MKIGIVCPYEWSVPGGVKNHVQSLAAELRMLGHKVDILAPTDQTHKTHQVISLGKSTSIKYNGSVARIAVGPGKAKQIKKLLEQGNYDILHVHEPLSPGAGQIATMQASVPVVGTFHAYLDHSTALQLSAPLLKKTFQKLNARIAVSKAAQKTWQRYFGQAPFNIIPNGVGHEFFSSPKPIKSLDDGRPNLVFVGRIEPRKGLKYLIKAFLILKTVWPQLRLVVVGRNDPQKIEKMLSKVPEEAKKDILFTGSVSQVQLPKYYASATVFCAPSLGGESFGIILAEAMAVGAPIVCSDIAGYKDVVKNGREALLVKPGDVLSLSGAIERLLADPKLRAKMSKAGQKRARQYSWSLIAKKIEAVYKKLKK